MNFLRKLRTHFRQRKLETEMADEMRHHVELQTELNVKAGMNPDDARFAALRQFGNVASIQEQAREQRGWVWVGHFIQDLGYGWRMLRGSPIFTAVTVLSLALGIGAATSLFSLVNAILLKSLPVPNPQELRLVHWNGTETHFSAYAGNTFDDVPGHKSGDAFSTPAFHALREQCRDQAEVFGYFPIFRGFIARAQNEAVNVQGLMVSGNFFSALGVQPQLGRLFSGSDEQLGSAPAVIISYRWWERQFACDPAAIGRPITLNGHSFTIAGVLPAAFTGVCSGMVEDIYVSFAAQPQLMPFWGQKPTESWYVVLMARLRPQVSDAQFQSALTAALKGVVGAVVVEPGVSVHDGHDGPDDYRWTYGKELLLLLSVVGVVLLVVCANVGGLSLARVEIRQHEFSVRIALGAGRGRVIRQCLTESMLLAMLGGGLGVLVSIWGRMIISRVLAGSVEGLNYDAALDLKVLAFAIVVSVGTALVFGLLPSLKAARVDTMSGLKDRTSLGLSRLRVGPLLVAAQIALSLLVMTGAGLCLRTLVNLKRVDPGFNMDNLLLFQVNPGDATTDFSKLPEYYDKMLSALSVLPGVKSSALTTVALLSGYAEGASFTLSAHSSSGKTEVQPQTMSVSESYFATMGIPVILGRELNVDDTGELGVVVVNESFVRKYFPGENPLGQTLQESGNRPWQIVGVCRDVKCESIKTPVAPTVHFSFRQRTHGSSAFAVRTLLPPLSLAAAVRKTAVAVDPTVPLTDLRTQEQARDGSIRMERTLAVFCGALAALVLLLSSIGLYGLMAYDVTRRSGEIGVRMMLGATSRQIIRPILRQALMVVGIGVAVGLPMTLMLTKLIRSNLYAVKETDPATLGAAVLLLMAVALIAAWFPARRATKVDPMVALRTE